MNAIKMPREKVTSTPFIACCRFVALNQTTVSQNYTELEGKWKVILNKSKCCLPPPTLLLLLQSWGPGCWDQGPAGPACWLQHGTRGIMFLQIHANNRNNRNNRWFGKSSLNLLCPYKATGLSDEHLVSVICSLWTSSTPTPRCRKWSTTTTW